MVRGKLTIELVLNQNEIIIGFSFHWAMTISSDIRIFKRDFVRMMDD